MKKLEQVPRYQKDINVKEKKISREYAIINKILNLLPKKFSLLDIGAAEGFICWMALKAGYTTVVGIECDEGRVGRGRKNLGLNGTLLAGDVFKNMKRLDDADIIVISRFLHNVGEGLSHKLMERIDKKKDYILIIRYKPGARKENNLKRELLATKIGVNGMLGEYKLAKKSFPQDTIVAIKGKYRKYLRILRAEMGEGA